MSSDLFEIIIPSVAFLMAFFLAYTLLEMGITLFLNAFIFRHWGFAAQATDPRPTQDSGHIELGICLFISAFVITMVCYSRIFDILLSSSAEVRVFTLELFLAMLLVYSLTTHQLQQNNFVKKIHKYLFFYLSSIVFVLSTLFANQYYETYKNYIHANLIAPLAGEHPMTLESRERKRLLALFRHQIYNDLCPRTDYTTVYKSGRVTNFVYVVTHPDLSIADKPILRSNLKDYLSGRLCTSKDISFLLTDHGQWYWVVEGTRIAQSITQKG